MASSLNTLLQRLAKMQQGAPYDKGLATAIQNAQYQMSDLDRQYTRGQQGIQSGYSNAATELAKQRDLEKTATQNKFADQGMGFSGIHAAQQGRVEEGYQSGLAGAVQRRLEQLNTLGETKRGAESGIQNMLVNAQGEYTSRRAQEAQAQAAAKAQAAAQAEQNRLLAAQTAAMQNMGGQSYFGGGGGGYGGGGGGGGFGGGGPEPKRYVGKDQRTLPEAEGVGVQARNHQGGLWAGRGSQVHHL